MSAGAHAWLPHAAKPRMPHPCVVHAAACGSMPGRELYSRAACSKAVVVTMPARTPHAVVQEMNKREVLQLGYRCVSAAHSGTVRSSPCAL